MRRPGISQLVVATAVLAVLLPQPALGQAGVGSPSGGRVVNTRPPFNPQDVPDLEVLRQIQSIVHDRPPQAEAAARAFLMHVVPERAERGEGGPRWPVLDQLKSGDRDAYWREVAQLVMQFEMLQNAALRDTVRARFMKTLFGTEFEARVVQRTWRGANESERQQLRRQLEGLMTRHVEAEDELRELEIRDIRRRLADVQAESERRRQQRTELVRWAVDDIVLQASRPEF